MLMQYIILARCSTWLQQDRDRWYRCGPYINYILLNLKLTKSLGKVVARPCGSFCQAQLDYTWTALGNEDYPCGTGWPVDD